MLKDAEKYPVGHLTNKRWEKQQHHHQQQTKRTDGYWLVWTVSFQSLLTNILHLHVYER